MFESPHATVAATRLVRVERDEYVAAHMLPSVGANEYIASYGELGSTAMPASLLAAADDFEAKRAAYLAATHAAEAATIVRVVTPAPVISTVPIVSPVPVITITERLAVAA